MQPEPRAFSEGRLSPINYYNKNVGGGHDNEHTMNVPMSILQLGGTPLRPEQQSHYMSQP